MNTSTTSTRPAVPLKEIFDLMGRVHGRLSCAQAALWTTNHGHYARVDALDVEAMFGEEIRRLEDLIDELELHVPAPGTAGAPGHLTVTLNDFGANKVGMIKVIREITGLGLEKAKDLVENTPSVIVSGATPAQASDALVAIEDAGGVAQVSG